jgi:cell division septum initiation protein DivIVA
MPDENSAAEEHAILQEVTAPLATLPADALPSVTDVEFPIALRGYDRLAVDAYVRRTSQLVAELQSTRSPEAAVRRGLERVGEEVSGILQRAHDAASQITAQSRSEAEERLEQARQEAAQITADSERRLQELDAETDRIWAERQRIVEDAQALARQLLSLAHAAAARFPAADEPATTQEKPSRPFGVPVPGVAAGVESESVADVTPEEPDHEAEASPESIVGPDEAESPEAGVSPEEGVSPEDVLTEEPAGEVPPDGLDDPGFSDEETTESDDPDATRVMPPITSPREDEPH